MTWQATAANLIINELMPRCKKAGISIVDSPVSPEQITRAAKQKEAGVVTTNDIRQMMDAAFK